MFSGVEICLEYEETVYIKIDIKLLIPHFFLEKYT
jgi:hypothetical protein